MASPTDAIIAVASAGATLGVAWLTLRGKLAELRSAANAAPEHVAAAEAASSSATEAAQRADSQALAFASGYSELYRQIETCREECTAIREESRAQLAEVKADAATAKADAAEARAAEERCHVEQRRLEAMVEGILSDRRREH